jgi:hypothetical protein
MRPPTKLQVFANFSTQKMLQPFITPPPHTHQIYLRQTIFCFFKLKIKLKGLHFADVAEIQEAITDELKKTQKEEFSAAFHKLYNHAKACKYANGAHFELKKKGASLMCLKFLKNQS